MVKKNKNQYRIAFTVGALVILAWLLRMIGDSLQSVVLQTLFTALRNSIHLSLLILWCISLHRRLVNKKVRRLMLTVGGLLIFWLVDKIVKWDFTGSVTHPLVRYLWYGFYIPMLFVPTLGAFIIDYLGKPEGYTHKKFLHYLLIPPSLLLLSVFTNDLHQKVFVFYNGMINFDKEYSYDWLYFFNMGWFIVMGFYFVLMLLLKSRVPGRRKLRKMPLLIMIFGALFWVGYSMRLYDCDLTVMDCLIIALLLESAIQSGLLPSNSGYRELFDATTVPVQIVDRDYQPHYVSKGALPLPEELMRKTEEGTVPMGDFLLRSAPITAGRVVWQDDISRLNELRLRLQDTREQLDEENILLQAELELKERQAKADEENRLYDRIAKEVEPQLIKADQLLRQIEGESDDTQVRRLLARVCVLGSYIKRRGNLLLLGEEAQLLPARELEYCIRESLDNLRLGQVYTSLRCSCEGKLPLEHIVAAYDFYENMAERLLDDLTALLINLHCGDGTLQMNLQMGCSETIARQVLADVTVARGSFTYELMQEDVVIRLSIPGKEAGL